MNFFEAFRKSDRVLLVLLALSLAANAILVVYSKRNADLAIALKGRLNESQPVSAADMAVLAADHAPTAGSADAPITAVLFADFQCPYCQRFASTLERLNPRRKSNLRLIFRQFPLPIHPYARETAELSACVGSQSNQAFWALSQYLFAKANSKGDPRPGAVIFLQSRSDISMPDVKSCLDSHSSLSLVQHDLELGKRYGVHATPTMFVNGTRLVGDQNAEYLDRLIDSKVPAGATNDNPEPK